MTTSFCDNNEWQKATENIERVKIYKEKEKEQTKEE